MTTKNIYQRLNEVMKSVSYVQKEDKKVNNQYTFVSHDAVTAKVRPILIENGIVLTASVESFRQDGNRTEAMVILEFVNMDKPDERITIKSFGFGIDPQDKGPGKAISYAVKYGILKTLCLETGDDPERESIPYQQQVIALSDDDMDTVCFAMEEAGDFDSLKGIFGPAYKKASATQQAALKKTYGGIKAKHKWE